MIYKVIYEEELVYLKRKDIENKIYVSKDSSLIEFIHENFELEGPVCKCEYHNNMNTLEKLNNRTINTGLARMERIKNDNDIGWLPIYITLFLFMFTFMGPLYKEEIMEKITFWGPLIGVTIIIGGSLIVTNSVKKTVKLTGHNKMTANYFSELLKEIKEDKKNMNNK